MINVMKRIFQFKRMYLLLALPAGLLLVLAAKADSRWVETLYAQRFHLFLERTIGRAISALPFSVSEILIALAVLGALFYIGFTIRGSVHNRAWKHVWYRFSVNVLCAAAVGYFLFVITMGLNYYRASVTEYLGLETGTYSTQQLEQVCAYLAEQINQTRAALPEDENGVAQLKDTDFSDLSAAARDCFNEMAADHPGIGTLTARNKPMLSSRWMSRMLTMGVYFPITMESNINVDMTSYTIPATMCHELAHVKGFMREDEANFLGFLATTYATREDIRYSGYMMAFGYALQQLAQADRTAAVRVAQTVSDGVLRDDRADEAYWQPFRNTTIADASGKVYDAYLQSNDQKDGVKSYGRMVDLLLAWYFQK